MIISLLNLAHHFDRLLSNLSRRCTPLSPQFVFRSLMLLEKAFHAARTISKVRSDTSCATLGIYEGLKNKVAVYLIFQIVGCSKSSA